MFPTGNGPGIDSNTFSQHPNAMQNQSSRNIPQSYYSQPNQLLLNPQQSPMNLCQPAINQMPLPESNQQLCRNTNLPSTSGYSSINHHSKETNRNKIINYTSFSDDDSMLSEEEENANKHPWQIIGKKRRRITRQSSTEIAPQIETENRYQLLSEADCNESQNKKNTSNTKTTEIKNPRPPPIYIYGVKDYKAMVANLASVAEEETYFTKALPNNTIKINPQSPDTYRKLIHHIREEKIVHHTYQIKQERAYRIVIRDLHHSIPLTDITEELEKYGHKVRNIINVRHRMSKEPLPMFFVDLEPQNNNKEVFNLQLLQNCKIRIEPPRNKSNIIQCTRCQDYGHSKTYCMKPYNCVKCGGPHDTKICKKSSKTPATCILCGGDHPANYKGCTVYRDLINSRNKDNTKNSSRQGLNAQINTNTPTQQITHNLHQNGLTYAQITAGTPIVQTNTNNNNVDIADKLTNFLNEFKNMFSQLINQNSMILTMLTTVINKLTQ